MNQQDLFTTAAPTAPREPQSLEIIFTAQENALGKPLTDEVKRWIAERIEAGYTDEQP